MSTFQKQITADYFASIGMAFFFFYGKTFKKVYSKNIVGISVHGNKKFQLYDNGHRNIINNILLAKKKNIYL